VTGAEHPTADEPALRAHIIALVRRLYGERLTADSPQVSAWLGLYRGLYFDTTQTGAVQGTASERAWRGLVVAMLRSPRMLLY
jgi:hypothetical protein